MVRLLLVCKEGGRGTDMQMKGRVCRSLDEKVALFTAMILT